MHGITHSYLFTFPVYLLLLHHKTTVFDFTHTFGMCNCIKILHPFSNPLKTNVLSVLVFLPGKPNLCSCCKHFSKRTRVCRIKEKH